MDRNKEWYDVAVIDSGIGEYGRCFRNSYAGQINFFLMNMVPVKYSRNPILPAAMYVTSCVSWRNIKIIVNTDIIITIL